MTTPFDMNLIQCGARLRRSPFFESTQAYGAKAYTVYNHMLFPIRFADLEEEFWHLVEHVTLWDVAVERQVEITGPDALAFANLLTPRDLGKCAVGQGKYVVITGEDGGIINDPVLLRLGENHFWLALADSDVLLWARGVAYHRGFKVTITEPDVSPLQVQGPKARPLIEALFGKPAPRLAYYHFLETSLDGIPVVLTRTGWTGEIGYEIYLRDGSRGNDLWERIMAAGKPFNLRPTGPSDIRRIEAGILNWGADIRLDTNVYEVGLERLVDEGKRGDFIGREALERIRASGPTRKLVGVEIAGAAIEFNTSRWPVTREGQAIGHITSAIHSPRLKKNIGYAMVPVAHAPLGTRLDLTLPGGERRSATVVTRPFLDPAKAIPKS